MINQHLGDSVKKTKKAEHNVKVNDVITDARQQLLVTEGHSSQRV